MRHVVFVNFKNWSGRPSIFFRIHAIINHISQTKLAAGASGGERKGAFGMRMKMALMLCAVAAALFTGAEAFRSLRPAAAAQIPRDVYALYSSRAGSAAFYLREEGGYVAVFSSRRGGEPLRVTPIELETLRGGDRAMIRAGLPVEDETELLMLLEDFGR